ncbi:MAG: hypothetical protein HGA22_02775 [Clostridiales bacterium]|nr:hypothetical protein [Clostridiales bacterium]
MNTYANISRELKAWFSNNSVFKILLPIDMVLLFAGLILIFIDYVLGINMGGLINGLAFWIFIAGLLLAYANLHNMYLYIGMFGYGAIQIITLVIYLFKYKSFSWGSLFYAAVFAWLGYVALKNAGNVSSYNSGNDGSN